MRMSHIYQPVMIKTLLQHPVTSATARPPVQPTMNPPTLPSDYNVWNDPERLKTIRHPSTVVICQDSGELVPLEELENIITENGIKVNNTFYNKSGRTVVTASSPAEPNWRLHSS